MGEAAANYPTPAERLKEVTDKLEQGVKDLFESSRYADYLKTMSRFHRYSCNNVLLISLRWKRVDGTGAFVSLLIGSAVAMGWHVLGNPFGVQPLWPACITALCVLILMTLRCKEAVSAEYRNYQEIMLQYQKLPKASR